MSRRPTTRSKNKRQRPDDTAETASEIYRYCLYADFSLENYPFFSLLSYGGILLHNFVALFSFLREGKLTPDNLLSFFFPCVGKFTPRV